MAPATHNRISKATILLVIILSSLVAGNDVDCTGRQRMGGGSRGGQAGRVCEGRTPIGPLTKRPNTFSRVPLTEIRSINGSEDSRGQAGAVLLRLTPHAYPDGIGNQMVDGPSPRLISNVVADDRNTEMLEESSGDQVISDMFWIWGQFLDHDIDHTATNGESFPIVSPDCMADIMCMIPFIRSEHIILDGVREQVNGITAFIDASMVYGSNLERANAIRSFQGGKLKMAEGDLLHYNTYGLPNAAPEGVDPTTMSLAGDVRANEHTGLLAMHTIFVREHNRLADLLVETYRRSGDEEIYQMARKIVGAEIQRITYNEFLPLLLGPMYTPSLEHAEYDPNVNPAIANEFSTVAFRVGHTMLSGSLMMHEQSHDVSLVDAFFNPDLLMSQPDNMDYMLAGFCHQRAQEVDTLVVDAVRNFLFGFPEAGVGHDLVSLNIQRGRDHGIRKYNALREGLGLPAAESFADITSNFAVQEALSEAYDGDVNQVDAWIGGLAEEHVPGGMVGETFAFIISDQMTRLMLADQFFYLWDNDLTRPRLVENVIDVSTVTLADVLDANTNLFSFHDVENVFFTSTP